MDVSIIIVSWNVRDLLRKCLASLYQNQGAVSMEVIVVDNHSSDGTVAMIEREFPRVRVMALIRNIGFARANNRALPEASGRYVMLLNPDTEVLGDALDTLSRYLDDHPEVAVVAPQIINPDQSFQVGSVRRNPTLGSQLLIMLKLQHLLKHARVLQEYYCTDFKPDQEQAVDQVMGAALCIRSSFLQRVGFFDEKFFLWFEEVDLCRRIRRAGGEIRYYPHARVIHHGGQSFKLTLPLAKQQIYNRSAVYYFYKHHGLLAALLLAATIPFNMTAMALYQTFRKHAS